MINMPSEVMEPETSSDLTEEILFDIQGLPQPVLHLTELISKVSLGLFLVYFSFHELLQELRQLRNLTNRGVTGG